MFLDSRAARGRGREEGGREGKWGGKKKQLLLIGCTAQLENTWKSQTILSLSRKAALAAAQHRLTVFVSLFIRVLFLKPLHTTQFRRKHQPSCIQHRGLLVLGDVGSRSCPRINQLHTTEESCTE